MPNFIVLENTPGYLPEEDDPFITDDYSAAVAYMNERVEEYEDHIAEGGGEPATSRGPRSAYVTDMTREHDLGRNFSVDEYEES